MTKSRVFGCVDTSGAGKTKMAFSPALTNQAHVVYIRLADTRVGALLPPVSKLRDELVSLHTRLIERVRQDGAAACDIPTAKLALDLVREFVCSYYDILIEADEACEPATIEEQRRLWVAILENGFPLDRLSTRVSERLAARLSPNFSGNTQTAMLALETKLRERISRLGVDGSQAPLILFMDELNAAKDICPGLWFHMDELKNGSHKHRLYELSPSSSSPDTNKQQPSDLYYAIRLVLSEVATRAVGAVYAGTHLWLHDDLRLGNSISPLNSQLFKWREFHAMRPSDMLDFLGLYFDGIPVPSHASQERDVCLAALTPLQGRPHFFFMTFLDVFLDHVKNANNTEEMVAMIRETARKAATSVSSQVRDRVRTDWRKHTQTPSPFVPTSIAANVRQMYLCARLSNGVLPFTAPQLADMLSVGVLFFGSDQSSYNLRAEPLTFQTLLEEGDAALQCEDFTTLIDRAPTSLGERTELKVAWHFVRQVVLAGAREVLMFEAVKELLPRGYALPGAVSRIILTASTAVASPLSATTVDEIRASNHVLHTLPQPFGPDIIVPGQTYDSNSILAIQCKSGTANGGDASVTPGWIYAARDSATRSSFHRTALRGSVRPDRAAFAPLFREEVSSGVRRDARWVRCVYTLGRFSDQLVQRINAWNRACASAAPFSCILLLQGNDENAPSVNSLVSDDDLKFLTIDQVDAVCSGNPAAAPQEDLRAANARLVQEVLQLRARNVSYTTNARFSLAQLQRLAPSLGFDDAVLERTSQSILRWPQLGAIAAVDLRQAIRLTGTPVEFPLEVQFVLQCCLACPMCNKDPCECVLP
ncbi:hypothetical protein CAOG_02619 [Capsaspora owczarzaki ATCC 30864]|uniref:Uncharacterized protein n=1 Tax=Capsaspora owczarzaki (strain ATCC 30864) TaxID=595528 RepID=A0A0D2X1V9_CAPO3|nr:hypothetical protein CAOG_02619 [Capsaspora owczarzaki ATCC 30864]KJE91489.1 hypothetical protein CAOG_002619 [Capsaspora owczarzaki ATCC 30864]|eukprot:XP_004349369.1 hypothetical protein CAOG_02619 [Capsaspora owczarzaki ATCC 30864]